jgi:SAM-dependent methyltransferase
MYNGIPMMNVKEPMRRKVNWSETLFIEFPYLFLPELEKLEAQTELEINGLCKIFHEFKIGHGSRILDLSCGIGRHTIGLARRGYEVVGYDPSNYFLKVAKDRVSSLSFEKPVTFYEGGMDKIQNVLTANGESGFDVIISMFNSLGYINQDEDLKLIRDVLSLCNQNGIFITETENRDWRIRNFMQHNISEFRDIQLLESWIFDLDCSTAESITRYYRRDRSNSDLHLILDLHTRMRLYSFHELIAMLHGAGWQFQAGYGSIALLNPLSLDSPEIVTVSKNDCRQGVKIG